jgi:[ribosomal protein S5]-alanine N-acetyltransferase
MQMPLLETERLLVRPFVDGDLPGLIAVLEIAHTDGHAAAERYVRHGALNATVLAELGQPPYGDRAVVLRTTGELAGVVGLVPSLGPFDQLRPVDQLTPTRRRPTGSPLPALQRPEVGLYYHVRRDLRRRGYATEAARAMIDFAFGQMRLARIVATTERDNIASQAVMRRLGMRIHENALGEPDWFQVVGIVVNPAGTMGTGRRE